MESETPVSSPFSNLQETVGKDRLEQILKGILEPVQTSAVIYDVSGNQVAQAHASDFLELLASASSSPHEPQRNPYNTIGWNQAAYLAIQTGKTVDTSPCPAGLRRFAAPIIVDSIPVGAIVILYGKPPVDLAGLRLAAKYYQVDPASLRNLRASYVPPPNKVVKTTKIHLVTASTLIAEIYGQSMLNSGRDMDLDYLESVLDGFLDPALIIAADYRVIGANYSFLRKVKLTRQQVVGKSCQELSHRLGKAPCNDPINPCPARTVWETSQSSRITHRGIGPEGQQATDIVASPVFDREGQVTAVIEIFRDFVEQRMTSSIKAINQLGQELILTRDEAKIAHAVVEAARQTLNFEACSLLLERDGFITVIASAGYGPRVKDFCLPVGDNLGITAAVVHSGEPIYLPDVRQDPRYVVGAGYQALSELCVPLKVSNRVLGALNVESDELNAFDGTDLQLLTTLADVAAVALDSASAYHAQEQQAAEMTALYQLGVALVTERDPAVIASRIFDELGHLLQADIAVLSLVNQETGELIAHAVDKDQSLPIARLALHGKSLSAHVVRTGRSRRFSKGKIDQPAAPAHPADETPLAWIGVPLKVADRIIGVLSIQSHRSHPFGTREEQLLTQVAAQVAPVLENAALYHQTRQRMSELETLFTVTASLSSDLSLQHLLPIVARELAAAVDVASCAILEWDKDARTLTTISQFTSSQDQDLDQTTQSDEIRYSLTDRPSWEAVLLTREPLTRYFDAPPNKENPGTLLDYSGAGCALILPMIAHGQVIGLVELCDEEPDRRFNEKDLRLAQTTANQAAIAIRHAQLFDEIRHRLAREEQLNKIAHALAGEMDLDTLIPRLLHLMAELTGADAGAVEILDLDQQIITQQFYYNLPNLVTADQARFKQGVASEALKQRNPTLIIDYPTHPAAQKNWIDIGIRSALSVPLLVKDQPIGILGLFSLDRIPPFDTGTISAAEAAGQLAAVAIQRSTLFQAERQQRQQAEVLRAASLALGATLDTNLVLETLLDQIRQVIPYDAGNIMWIEKDQARIILQRGYREVGTAELVDGLCLPVSETPNLQLMYSTQRPHIISDPHNYAGWVNLGFDQWIRSWAGAPIVIRDQVVGFFSLDSKTAGQYSPEHINLLAAFANHAAVAIENANLYQTEQIRREQSAALNRITGRLASGLTFRQLFQGFPADLQVMVAYDEASLTLLVDPAEPTQSITYLLDDQQGILPGEARKVSLGDSPAIGDLMAGHPHLIRDFSTEPDPCSPAADFRSELRLPLMARGRIIGWLGLASRESDAFSKNHIPLMQQVADVVASSVDNAQLYQAVQDHASQLEEQVRARTAELQAERDRTQAILDSAAEGVIVTDRGGKVLYVNPAIEKLTGYSAQETIGQYPSLWQSDMHDDRFFQDMWQTALEGRVWDSELINRRKDGSLYDARLTIAPIPGPDGQIVGFVGIQNDISQLKELDRMKDRFVSNVSHELRTPLTNLKLYLSLLENGPPNKRHKYMETLGREADRLYQLIEDLLSLSRMDVGNLPIKCLPTDLNHLVQQLVRDRVSLAAQQGLMLRDELEPDLPLTQLDEKMIVQLITNLMTNAMNYTPENGEILVQTATVDDQGRKWVTVQVTDTGYGITEKDQEHLFERFHRGEAARKTGAPGTGLGLAICKEIVERHQGHITVSSVPGEGSSFTVWLPTVEEEADPPGR